MPRKPMITSGSSSSLEIPEKTPPTSKKNTSGQPRATLTARSGSSRPLPTLGTPPPRFNFQVTVSSASIRKSKLRQPTTLSYSNIVESALRGPPPAIADPITYRTFRGKPVRDVLIDTHDLINEPGGYIINLLDPNDPSPEKIHLHLGIKEKHYLAKDSLSLGVVSPGTITVSDDYARDIYRAAISSPNLRILTALLEVNDENDLHEFKTFKEYSPEFLNNFIHTYPTNLTVFHVEMPGVSLVYLPEWKFLMDQQRSLKVLICNFGVVLWYFYENCVLQNVHTLTSITLRRVTTYDITTSSYHAFEWNIFSDCSKLEKLKITSGYKCNAQYLGLPVPPSAVFVHTNLDLIPEKSVLKEVHLAGIWIEPRSLYDFLKRRPYLSVCSPCFDMEYSTTDKPPSERKLTGATTVKIVSVSRIEPEENEIPFLDELDAEDDRLDEEGKRKAKKQAKLSCLVLTMFQVILAALAFLFIIVFFRHLKDSFSRRSNNATQMATAVRNISRTRAIQKTVM